MQPAGFAIANHRRQLKITERSQNGADQRPKLGELIGWYMTVEPDKLAIEAALTKAPHAIGRWLRHC